MKQAKDRTTRKKRGFRKFDSNIKALKKSPQVIVWAEPGCAAEEFGRGLLDPNARPTILHAQALWSSTLSPQERHTAQTDFLNTLKANATKKQRSPWIICVEQRAHDVRLALSEKRLSKALYDYLLAHAVSLPPLRERIHELPALVQQSLEMWQKKTGVRMQIDMLAHQQLLSYDWPGNENELRDCLERAANTAKDGVITVDDLQLPIVASSGDALYPQHLPSALRTA